MHDVGATLRTRPDEDRLVFDHAGLPPARPNATYSGTVGGDVLTGTGENDYLDGKSGDDVLSGAGGNDTVHGGVGADSLYGGAGNDLLDGNAGNDIVYGVAGTDTITLGDGDDRVVILAEGGNIASLDGGAGYDVLDGSGAVYRFNVSAVVNVEKIILTNYNDTFIGSAQSVEYDGGKGDDFLDGGAGADTLLGQDGDDQLRGSAGNDLIDGGAGSNVAFFDNAPGGVKVNLFAGTATGDGRDTLLNISRVVGSAFDDVLVGNGEANVFYDRGGADTINGAEGDDTLVVNFTSEAMTVDLANGVTSGGAGSDRLSSIENVYAGGGADRLTGSAQANLLNGNAGADTLLGGDGADTLDGYTGDDSVLGGLGGDLIWANLGNDTYDGGDGVDTLSYAAFGAGSTVDLALGVAQVTAAGSDLIRNVENLVGSTGADVFSGAKGDNLLDGQDGDDRLTGLKGADSLLGGAGGDTLSGGADADVLTGGAGADRFLFGDVADSKTKAADRITDLTTEDIIDLSAIDADQTTDGDQAFVLVQRFGGVAGEAVLKYSSTAGATTLSLDVDGDGRADSAVTISGDRHDFTNFVL